LAGLGGRQYGCDLGTGLGLAASVGFSTGNTAMDAPKQQPESLSTDCEELARTESMIARCETRITAQLELLANLAPWELKSQTVRKEVDVTEDVLQALQTQRSQLLSILKRLPIP
jgi:hypothetical protein